MVMFVADAGLLCGSIGYAGMTDSATRLVLAGVLWLVLRSKVEAEERLLRDVHGQEYDTYSKKVPYALFPFLE